MINETLKVFVKQYLGTKKPLARSLVLEILNKIDNDQPFIVIFKKKNGDLRVMSCIVNDDEATAHSKRTTPTSIYTVWDREADGFRSFKLDSVLALIISN